MTALAKDRNTPARTGETFERPVKGATTIFAGGLVCLDANGWAVPGAVATTLVADGRAERQVVNAGADGAETITVRPGTYRFANSAAADAITKAVQPSAPHWSAGLVGAPSAGMRVL